jgi:hypothetical protein
MGILWAQTGAYTLTGGSASLAEQAFAATATDQSAIYVTSGGSLTLTHPTVTKSGASSNTNTSSQYGLNAGVLANSAGKVTITGGSITTNASGANGLFASGSGSVISMTDGTITTTGGASHGVDVTYGGTISLTNVSISTAQGTACAALSTDFGGGTVNVSGGTMTTAGSGAPGIYSTGAITVRDAVITATAEAGGVIDGANSITLNNTSLTGTKYGIRVFRSAPGSGTATISITGGSLTATAGDAFLVTTSSGPATAVITAKGGAVIRTSTGNLVNAINSSTVVFTADGETLTGNLVADSTGTLTAVLQNSTTLAGTISRAALTLDASSLWNVQGNSTLTTLADAAGISGDSISNISGNGYIIFYDAKLAANSYLGGKTYALRNGGQLTPSGSTAVLAITTSQTLPAGLTGIAYSQTLSASGGTPPYSWTLVSGTLPAGLTLSSSGSISGTPTATGIASFLVRATDSASAAATQTFSLTITAQSLDFSNALRIAQVADGSNWRTLFAILNLDQAPVSYALRFWDDNGSPLPLPLVNGASGTLAVGSAAFAETPGLSATLLQGWAEAASTGRIGVLAIFRQSIPGTPDSEGSVSGTLSGKRILMPFDNTQGFLTAVAMANTSADQTLVISISFQTENGTPSTGSLSLPPRTHRAFFLPALFPSVAGVRGSVEFSAPSSDMTIVGLRYSPNNSFTTLVVLQ